MVISPFPKRLFDLSLAVFGVVLFSPFFALAALLIYLEDRGPIFFRQERLGKHLCFIRIFKFRSMRDGKITRVGQWLRRTGLDETAQFLNVLRGEMSMTGPRPLTTADVQRLGWASPKFADRWDLNPGITGLAQVLGGVSPRHSLKLDRLYRKRESLWLDFKLNFISFLINGFGKARIRNVLRRARRRKRHFRTLNL